MQKCLQKAFAFLYPLGRDFVHFGKLQPGLTVPEKLIEPFLKKWAGAMNNGNWIRSNKRSLFTAIFSAKIAIIPVAAAQFVTRIGSLPARQ